MTAIIANGKITQRAFPRRIAIRTPAMSRKKHPKYAK
jgi:hypothetical protein